MKLILIACMLLSLTSCFEKPIDYRLYAFPKDTTSYNLINYRNPDDFIKVDVSVQKTTPEQVWILKDYKNLNTKTLETYVIGDKEITKTSHKVDGQETLGSPISFPRFVKSKEQYGPRSDSIFGQYGDKLLNDCSFLDYSDPKKQYFVKLGGRLGFDIRMESLVETYCANNGLMALKMDNVQYMIDVRGFNGCNQKSTNGGLIWECSPTK